MQQKKCGGVLGTCLPIENVDAVHLYRPIEDLIVHSCILCTCFDCCDARAEHHQDCGCHTTELSGVHDFPDYSTSSKIISSSIGTPNGRVAAPMTERTDMFPAPKTSRKRSEAPSATLG